MLKCLTPGSSIPCNNYREAPPPVETWLNLSDTPNLSINDTESPPPTIEVAPFDVASIISLNKASLDFLNWSNSITPTGPFQIIVFAFWTNSLLNLIVYGPPSIPSHPFSIPSLALNTLDSVSGLNYFPQFTSTGSWIYIPFLFAFYKRASTC